MFKTHLPLLITQFKLYGIMLVILRMKTVSLKLRSRLWHKLPFRYGYLMSNMNLIIFNIMYTVLFPIYYVLIKCVYMTILQYIFPLNILNLLLPKKI